jgi:hypothetical protein
MWTLLITLTIMWIAWLLIAERSRLVSWEAKSGEFIWLYIVATIVVYLLLRIYLLFIWY